MNVDRSSFTMFPRINENDQTDHYRSRDMKTAFNSPLQPGDRYFLSSQAKNPSRRSSRASNNLQFRIVAIQAAIVTLKFSRNSSLVDKETRHTLYNRQASIRRRLALMFDTFLSRRHGRQSTRVGPARTKWKIIRWEAR